jgi:hypothetical protein
VVYIFESKLSLGIRSMMRDDYDDHDVRMLDIQLRRLIGFANFVGSCRFCRKFSYLRIFL